MTAAIVIIAVMLLAFVVVFLGRITTLVALLLMLTYKSTVVSVFSCAIDAPTLFRVLQAVDFVFAGTVTLTILAISPPLRAALLRMGNKSARGITSRNMAFVALVLVYGLLLGLLLNPLDHVAIYLRLLSYPVLLYIVGVWLAHRLDWPVVALCVVAVLLPAALLVYAEFLVRPFYHDAINSACYQSLKFGRTTGWYRLEDILLFSKMRLFNLEFFGDIEFVKPFGVTLNYPSTSYLLLFGMTCAWLRRQPFLALVFLGALLLMTTKASLFMLLSLLLVPVLVRRLAERSLRIALWLWCLGFGAVATAGLMFSGTNIHAYSLLASLSSFPAHPQGGGIGSGGSWSVGTITRSWDSSMLVGDSGLAILINMLGVAGIAVFIAYAQVFVQAARRVDGAPPPREQVLVAAFGIGVMGNAILQELAVGPYAVGLALLLLVVVQNRRPLA